MAKSSSKWPFLTEAFILTLRENFPNTLPTKRGASTEDIAFLQGQQKVIDVLAQAFKNQSK